MGGRNNHLRRHSIFPKGKKRGKLRWNWQEIVDDAQTYKLCLSIVLLVGVCLRALK